MKLCMYEISCSLIGRSFSRINNTTYDFHPLKVFLSQSLQRGTFESMQCYIDILKRFSQEFKVAQKFALISFIILNQI